MSRIVTINPTRMVKGVGAKERVSYILENASPLQALAFSKHYTSQRHSAALLEKDTSEIAVSDATNWDKVPSKCVGSRDAGPKFEVAITGDFRRLPDGTRRASFRCVARPLKPDHHDLRR